ncbi:nuclease [Candidatus Magnetoovum chiemensis]|nr:nuclease [Candidatus Magnetoovum chiemensis]
MAVKKRSNPKKKKKIQKNIIIFALLLLLVLATGYDYILNMLNTVGNLRKNDDIRATVSDVINGDTIIITDRDGKNIKCRLYGIEAPKLGSNKMDSQPFSFNAKIYLSSLLLNKDVSVFLSAVKQDKENLCIIKKDGLEINMDMVIGGYAWAARYYMTNPYVSKYINLERRARRFKRGLWKQDSPVPPWQYKPQ